MKPAVKKFFKNVVKPAIRGAVKSVPLGNVALEIVNNATHEVKAANEAQPVVNSGDQPKPHNWISIAIQLIGVGVVLYAFFTKAITVDDVLNYLGIQ